MAQDELVLRVPPDSNKQPSSRTRVTSSPPQSTSPSQCDSVIKPRSHSRESSGASNLSVKFTVHTSDGSASPKASVKTVLQQSDLKTKPPLVSCLRKRHVEDVVDFKSELPHRQRHQRLRRQEQRQQHQQQSHPNRHHHSSPEDDELSFETDDDSLNVDDDVDRLSPDSVDGMLHGDSKSQNSDYGSFCNTPSETFGAVGGSTSGGAAGPSSSASPYHRQMSAGNGVSGPGGDAHHRGHQRNDSEIQMGNDASQRRPLLDNHDSSSDDDTGNRNSFGFPRKKGRMRATAPASGLPIDMPDDDDDTNAQQGDDSDDSDDEDGIPAEPIKTLIAFIFLFFAWVATTTSLALTHERVPEINPLPDLFLDNVQYQTWGLDASEILIMVSTWTAFLVTLFHKHRFIVLRRIFLLVGIHYYYRAITMYITVLPKSNMEYQCAPKLNVTTAAEIAQRVLKLLSGMGLSINGKHVYCGDYIYSGHTMTLITGYFVIREYSPKRWFLLHWASLCTTIAGVLMLLLARGHYSIDVLIAYWITTRVWWMYHTLANNDSLKGDVDNPQNYLNRIWWWYIFRYFEKNVPINLPRRFGWPLPKRLLRWKPASFFFRRRSLRSAASPSNSTAAVASPTPTPSTSRVVDIERAVP